MEALDCTEAREPEALHCTEALEPNWKPSTALRQAKRTAMGESGYTKLNDENYDSWEFEIRAELKKKGVLALVEGGDSRPLGSENSKAVKGWMTKKDLAAAEIIRRLEIGQFPHVRGYEDEPTEMWTRLRAFHLASGLGSLIAMWGKFTKLTKTSDVPMRTHIGNLRTLADKLKHLGDAPSDALSIAVLFGSLPSHYSSLIVSLDSHPQSDNLDFVIGRILNEEYRIGADPASVMTSTNALYTESRPRKIIDKSKITCFKCGKLGHFQSDCTETPDAATPVAAMALTNSSSRVTYAL